MSDENLKNIGGATLKLQSSASYEQGPDVFYPDELKNADAALETFSMRELYNVHSPQSEHVPYLSTAFSIRGMSTDDLKSADDELYQLVFDIKHCIFKAGNDTKLLFSVFDDTEKKFVTEEYCLHLSENNFPKVGSPEDCKVVFKNLTSTLLSHEVYIMCRIYRIGPMDAPDVMSHGRNNTRKKEGKHVTRPYAATVIRLKDHVDELMLNLGEEVKFEPGTAPICCPREESMFVGLAFDLIQNKKNTHFIAPLSIGIAHGFILYRGDIGVVEKNYAEFDKLTEIDTLSIDPSIHCDRHILYVTVHEVHVNQRKKRAPCNVCCKMQLRDNETYQVIPGAMMLGKGKMSVPTNEAVSPVYYHNNDPYINQSYHVLIPSNLKQLERCHLYFTCWHTPGNNKKPDERGFAYIKLFHDKSQQMITNNEYELPLYRWDKKANDYLNNSSLKPEGKPIKIYFRLSSTKVYSDIDVHRFLTWKEHDTKIVCASVKRVARQRFEKLLTILDDLMKNIFEIMIESQDTALVEQTFATLVCLLGDANKGVNAKYRPRLEGWIEKHFSFSKIWRTLALQQLRLLQWIASAEAVRAQSKDAAPQLKQRGAEMTRQLQQTMKGVKYLFNIMKRSCEIEVDEAKSSDAKSNINNEYNAQITELFSSMNRVMGLTEPKMVAGVQSFALRNFLSLLDSVPTQTSQELTQTVVKFVNSVQNQGVNISVEKLLLIRRALEHPSFDRTDIVNIMLPSICETVHHHMGQSIDERAACATIMQKCVQFLDPNRPRSVLYGSSRYPTELPMEKKKVNPSQQLVDEFSILMLKMFGILDDIRSCDLSEVDCAMRIFGKTIAKNKKLNIAANDMIGKLAAKDNQIISKDQLEIHRDFFVTIADLTRTVTGSSSTTSWGNKCDLVDKAVSRMRKENEDTAIQVIESVLRCCNNLLRRSVFKPEWLFMRMVEAEVCMRGLSWFGSTLKRNYLSSSFQHSLWKQWLRLGMLFLSNEDFSLEDMRETRADAIRKNYKDVRILAIKKLTVSWDVLTPHRAALADTMISAAVEASASEVEEIQEFAVDVYFQMVKSEFEASNNMNTVETHTIDQIDQLTAKFSHKKKVINRYLDFFRIRVRKKLDGTNHKLKSVGNAFISDIERLYGYLIQLKQLPNDADHEDERTSATLLLLNYLSSSGKWELYNRYIHHLAMMHQRLGNHIEAGSCFKRHADRLGWSDDVLKEEPLVGLEELAEWKRHVNLLELAHQHFMLGEGWEMAVKVCQELAHAFEHDIFDLQALSSILEKQSVLWKMISNQDRVFHSCYLVRFRGSFSDALRDKSFVYRSGNGKHIESVRDFTTRMKNKFPTAKVANASDPIPSEYEYKDNSDDSRYIQITTLSPSSPEEFDGGEFKWECTKAPLRLTKYYRENETNTFSYTFQKKTPKARKKEADFNEFRECWITTVFVVCEDSIPSMRRKVPVMREKMITNTPFQTAVNNLSSKNQELAKTIETVQLDPKHDVRALSMGLNGVLDAAVMGGINKYREAFFDGTYFNQTPTETEKVSAFVSALKAQMQIAKDGLNVYDKHAIDDLQPHVDHLRNCYKKAVISLHEFYKETQKYEK